ncbi:predicted protein [Naegleria gruberi]|uniref:Predicted protein n=1 Tax=Naegleria gruberi TaxID=5762 RepID=D2V854_NAEGR|nr:uncharacterized protein NAEGRDRAFT_65033 [Naegleria gruberi]EFC46985.1 predicted protein [Naegleria gruberi]|eukprot:XP_002679729.1 predicted protein [Naegleria gruberi strain NEG-M]
MLTMHHCVAPKLGRLVSDSRNSIKLTFRTLSLLQQQQQQGRRNFSSSILLNNKSFTNQLIIQKMGAITPQMKNKMAKKTRVNRENHELISEMDNLVLKDDSPILAQSDVLKKELVEFVANSQVKTGSEIIEHTANRQHYFTQQEIAKIHGVYKNSVFFKHTKISLEKYFLNYNVLVHKSKEQNDLYYIGHQLLKYILTKYFNENLSLVQELMAEGKTLNIINDKITKDFQIKEHLLEYFLNNNQLFYIYIQQNNLKELEPLLKDISFTSNDFINKSAHERIFKAIIGNIYMNIESFDIMMNHVLYPFIVKEFIPRFTELTESNLAQISTKKAFEKQMTIVEQFEYFHMRQFKTLPTYSSLTNSFEQTQMVQIYSSDQQLLSIGYGIDYKTAKEDAARRAILHFC